MAEGIAHAAIQRNYPRVSSQVAVSSAGIAAVNGNRATPEAIDAMRRRGIDISGHRARGVTGPLVVMSDLVLTMEERQRKVAASLAGDAPTPVFMLLKLAKAAEKAKTKGAKGDFSERISLLEGTFEAMERSNDWDRGTCYEVADPIGMPVGEYMAVAQLLSDPILGILDFLIRGYAP